jgi:hypothetical protein
VVKIRDLTAREEHEVSAAQAAEAVRDFFTAGS